MTITLAAYQPFEYTRSLVAYGKEALDCTDDLNSKIGRVAMAILSLLPVLLIDLILIPTAWLYNRCCVTRVPAPPQPLPRAPSLAPVAPPTPLQLTLPDARRILADSYYQGFFHGFPMPNELFVKHAISRAFQHNSQDTVTLIKQMIRNHGETDGDGAPPFDVFQWVSRALLAHVLVSRHPMCMNLYPAKRPSDLVADQAIESIIQDFDALLIREKAEIILHLTVEPCPQRDLNQRQRDLIVRLRDKAIAITQDPLFLGARGIYASATQNIDIL